MSLVEKRVYSSESLQFESGSVTGWKCESRSLGKSGCVERYLEKKS